MSQHDLAKIVGKNIAEQRRKIGMSQKDLATRLEITNNAIIRMEKGIIAPKMSRLNDIAEHLNCSVSLLFRTDGVTLDERAVMIRDMLHGLSPEAQDAVLEIMASATKFMRLPKE